MTTCRHCHKRKAIRGGRARGLCKRCHNTPAILALYPKRPTGGYRGWHDPTEAELDALIAEQLANKPDWWYDSKPHHGEIDRELAKLSAAISGGRLSSRGRRGKGRASLAMVK